MTRFCERCAAPISGDPIVRNKVVGRVRGESVSILARYCSIGCYEADS